MCYIESHPQPIHHFRSDQPEFQHSHQNNRSESPSEYIKHMPELASCTLWHTSFLTSLRWLASGPPLEFSQRYQMLAGRPGKIKQKPTSHTFTSDANVASTQLWHAHPQLTFSYLPLLAWDASSSFGNLLRHCRDVSSLLIQNQVQLPVELLYFKMNSVLAFKYLPQLTITHGLKKIIRWGKKYQTAFQLHVFRWLQLCIYHTLLLELSPQIVITYIICFYSIYKTYLQFIHINIPPPTNNEN